MLTFSGGTRLLRAVVKNRRLLLEMTKRDITDRYSGEVLGAVWAIIHPIVTTLVYLLVFGVIFKAKAEMVGGVPLDSTAYMIGGLIPWLVISDVLGRGPTIVSSQASLVKQVVFPVEVLPVKMVLGSTPTFVIGLLGLLIYTFVTQGRIGPSYLFYPVAGVMLYAFLIGLAFILAAAGIFIRDTKDVVQLYAMIGMYVAPIFYYMDWVPKVVRLVIYANPITVFIECFHDAAYYGTVRHPIVWVAALLLSALSLLGGASLFNRTKPFFGSFL